VGEIKMKMQKDGTELEKRLKGYIENECQKKLEENKRLLDEGIIKVSEQLKSENKNDTSWKEVVSKEVEDRLMVITADLTVVQKSVEETKGRIEEEADKLSRKNNIIVYNVPENDAASMSERNKADKDFCCGLMTEVLRVGYAEGDIVKVQRLGRRLETGKARPLMVKLSEARTKNLIMEFAPRLSQAKDQFKGVTISHDMTVRREKCVDN
jgi:hypothetical protein